LERDFKLLSKESVDFVFIPSVEEMYPADYGTYVEMQDVEKTTTEGKSRPGHFRGINQYSLLIVILG
jgi:pantoate--beta-alanine ligase